MRQKTVKTGRTDASPPIYISAADFDRIARLADAVAETAPSVADELYREMDRATVLPAADLPAGVVTMNTDVTFRDETTGREQSVRLVYPDEADIAAGRISILTPVGVALLGLSAGQRMSWVTRSGERRALTVLAVGRQAAA